MGSIYVSFIIKTEPVFNDNTEVLDKTFQSVYKPVIKFLYSHSDFPLSFAFSGSQIQYFKKRKNELIAILHELTDRKQVEILGGGYNEPLLPLLNSVDRNGQIDLLTCEIRQTFGKRPRGMTLFHDCWDSSLVNNIHTCGLEYVLLNSSLVPDNKRTFLPIFMSDLGKSVDIFLYYNELLPKNNMLAEEFIWNIEKSVLKIEKKETRLQLDADRIVTLSLTPKQAAILMESKWFESLEKYLKENPDSRIKLTTPNLYRQHSLKSKVPSYIPVGISDEVSAILQTVKSSESRARFPSTIYDFINTFKPSRKLYSRMMYLSMLVNQYKNDKMRKKSAREKLWQSQNGMSILCTAKNPFDNSLYRQQAYKNLTEAEKILRGDGKFEESVTCFDYDSDGLDEYVCRMEQYFAYISLCGGSVNELDVIKNACNYCDNLMRVLEYDDFEDLYDRGLFIDHLFTSEQLKKYAGGEAAGDGVFSRIQYSELKYSQLHHELQLCARAVWKPTGQTVYLKKKFVINSTGMYVQYILKNESNKPLNACFAVEANLTDISYLQKNNTGFSLEIVDNGEVRSIDTSKGFKHLNSSGKLNNIHLVRISDQANGTSFVFEPNEKCGFCFNPMIMKRPGIDFEECAPASRTYESTLYWNVSIEPGMETEKSINFTIIPVKKIKK